jgi:glutathione synthase
MKIAFLLYPTSEVKVDEDSSFWIMHELLSRGHQVTYFESTELCWETGILRARLTPARLDARKGFLPSILAKKRTDLSTLDAIFIRKEPPFDTEYLYALHLLELLKGKVFVLNDPAGIALCNEKLCTLQFERFIPESLVTNQASIARSFIRKLGHTVVIKPLHQKAGSGILRSRDRDKNLPSLLDIATDSGKKTVLIQRYIRQNTFGDKRILVLNGNIVGTFLRRPPQQDFRANLSVGGSMHRVSLTVKEKKMVEGMAAQLLRHGLYFVGLDVIGGLLSEVNVTSPSGIPEIKQLEGIDIEKDVANFIEQRLSSFSGRKR